MTLQSRTYLHTSAIILALSAGVCFFSFVSADPDLWGHIKFGEDLWETGTLSKTDPYSFTAQGKRWINHEWLTELVFYVTYRLLGDGGLLLGKLLIGLTVMGLLCKRCVYRNRSQKPNPLLLGSIMVLAAMVIAPGFMIRPQVFSFFFFSFFVHIFHAFFEKNTKRLYLLPLCMAMWVNLHGGFLMGWFLYAAITGWCTFSHFVFQKQKDLNYLLFWFAATSAAVLVNPYGYKLLLFLYKTLSMPRQISEWAPVSLWDGSHPYLKLMALLFCLTVLLRRSRLRGWETVGMAVTLFAAFRHERHAPFFAIMAAPQLVIHLSAFITKLHERLQPRPLSVHWVYTMTIIFTLAAAYQIYHGGRQYVMSGFRIIVDPQTYPVGAFRFLEKNRLEGNLILPFDWGEHAIWKLYPKCHVSIDGRFRTVYPEEVIGDHFLSENDRHGWNGLINKYDGDILLARQSPFFQDLIKNVDRWTYVYSDSLSIVFLRRNMKNADTLKRFEQNILLYPKAPPTHYFPG